MAKKQSSLSFNIIEVPLATNGTDGTKFYDYSLARFLQQGIDTENNLLVAGKIPTFPLVNLLNHLVQLENNVKSITKDAPTAVDTTIYPFYAGETQLLPSQYRDSTWRVAMKNWFPCMYAVAITQHDPNGDFVIINATPFMTIRNTIYGGGSGTSPFYSGSGMAIQFVAVSNFLNNIRFRMKRAHDYGSSKNRHILLQLVQSVDTTLSHISLLQQMVNERAIWNSHYLSQWLFVSSQLFQNDFQNYLRVRTSILEGIKSKWGMDYKTLFDQMLRSAVVPTAQMISHKAIIGSTHNPLNHFMGYMVRGLLPQKVVMVRVDMQTHSIVETSRHKKVVEFTIPASLWPKVHERLVVSQETLGRNQVRLGFVRILDGTFGLVHSTSPYLVDPDWNTLSARWCGLIHPDHPAALYTDAVKQWLPIKKMDVASGHFDITFPWLLSSEYYRTEPGFKILDGIVSICNTISNWNTQSSEYSFPSTANSNRDKKVAEIESINNQLKEVDETFQRIAARIAEAEQEFRAMESNPLGIGSLDREEELALELSVLSNDHATYEQRQMQLIQRRKQLQLAVTQEFNTLTPGSLTMKARRETMTRYVVNLKKMIATTGEYTKNSSVISFEDAQLIMMNLNGFNAAHPEHQINHVPYMVPGVIDGGGPSRVGGGGVSVPMAVSNPRPLAPAPAPAPAPVPVPAPVPIPVESPIEMVEEYEPGIPRATYDADGHFLGMIATPRRRVSYNPTGISPSQSTGSPPAGQVPRRLPSPSPSQSSGSPPAGQIPIQTPSSVGANSDSSSFDRVLEDLMSSVSNVDDDSQNLSQFDVNVFFNPGGQSSQQQQPPYSGAKPKKAAPTDRAGEQQQPKPQTTRVRGATPPVAVPPRLEPTTVVGQPQSYGYYPLDPSTLASDYESELAAASDENFDVMTEVDKILQEPLGMGGRISQQQPAGPGKVKFTINPTTTTTTTTTTNVGQYNVAAYQPPFRQPEAPANYGQTNPFFPTGQPRTKLTYQQRLARDNERLIEKVRKDNGGPLDMNNPRLLNKMMTAPNFQRRPTYRYVTDDLLEYAKDPPVAPSAAALEQIALDDKKDRQWRMHPNYDDDEPIPFLATPSPSPPSSPLSPIIISPSPPFSQPDEESTPMSPLSFAKSSAEPFNSPILSPSPLPTPQTAPGGQRVVPTAAFAASDPSPPQPPRNNAFHNASFVDEMDNTNPTEMDFTPTKSSFSDNEFRGIVTSEEGIYHHMSVWLINAISSRNNDQEAMIGGWINSYMEFIVPLYSKYLKEKMTKEYIETITISESSSSSSSSSTSSVRTVMTKLKLFDYPGFRPGLTRNNTFSTVYSGADYKGNNRHVSPDGRLGKPSISYSERPWLYWTNCTDNLADVLHTNDVRDVPKVSLLQDFPRILAESRIDLLQRLYGMRFEFFFLLPLKFNLCQRLRLGSVLSNIKYSIKQLDRFFRFIEQLPQELRYIGKQSNNPRAIEPHMIWNTTVAQNFLKMMKHAVNNIKGMIAKEENLRFVVSNGGNPIHFVNTSAANIDD